MQLKDCSFSFHIPEKQLSVQMYFSLHESGKQWFYAVVNNWIMHNGLWRDWQRSHGSLSANLSIAWLGRVAGHLAHDYNAQAEQLRKIKS